MAKLREVAKVKGIRVHDMRKVLTTWLAERRERPDILTASFTMRQEASPAPTTTSQFLRDRYALRFSVGRNHLWSTTEQSEQR